MLRHPDGTDSRRDNVHENVQANDRNDCGQGSECAEIEIKVYIIFVTKMHFDYT